MQLQREPSLDQQKNADILNQLVLIHCSCADLWGKGMYQNFQFATITGDKQVDLKIDTLRVKVLQVWGQTEVNIWKKVLYFKLIELLHF